MPTLNIDLNYFEHKKTKRLICLLGRGAEILPIRLWIYCGIFHSDTGELAGYSDQEIESIANWWGKSGDMLCAMKTVNYMHKRRKTWVMTGFLEHQGHITAYRLKGKAMAEARWSKIKDDAVSIASSIAASNARAEPTEQSRAEPTKGKGSSTCSVHGPEPNGEDLKAEVVGLGGGMGGGAAHISSLVKRIANAIDPNADLSNKPTLKQVFDFLKSKFEGAEKFAQPFCTAMRKQQWRDRDGQPVTNWQSMALHYASKAQMKATA